MDKTLFPAILFICICVLAASLTSIFGSGKEISYVDSSGRTFVDGIYLSRLVDTVGDGTGSTDCAVNGTNNHFTFTTAHLLELITIVGHQLSTGDGPFWATSDTTLPDGYTGFTDFYVIKIDDDTIKLASTEDNAIANIQINISSDGVGIHTLLIPTIFKIVPPPGHLYKLTRFIGSIQDGGATAANKYGAIPELANGLQIRCMRGNETIIKLTNNNPVTSTGQWTTFCFDVQTTGFPSGDDWTSVRWSFDRAGPNGFTIQLDGDLGDSFQVWLNDDLSSLSVHHFLVQGLDVTK